MPISHRWVNTVSGLSASCPNTAGAMPKSRAMANIQEEKGKRVIMEETRINPTKLAHDEIRTHLS